MIGPSLRPVAVAAILVVAVCIVPASHVAGAASHLHLEAVPSGDWVADVAGTIVVTARNSDDSLDTGYVGAVVLTSDDPSAHLPALCTFSAADAGHHAFEVTLGQSATVTATGFAPPQTITGGIHIHVAPEMAATCVFR